MKGYWVVLLSVALIVGCGGKKNGGDEDATDVLEEVAMHAENRKIPCLPACSRSMRPWHGL